MSQKKVKRFRKETRRVLREEFGTGLQALSKIVRPRPRWMPKRIWVLFYLPLFPKKYIKTIYNLLD